MNSKKFQTPPHIAMYMASLVPEGVKTVLEPTPGQGNLCKALSRYQVTAPENFFTMQPGRFDCVVMNPPFSDKYTFGVPEHVNERGMKIGYHILFSCMEMSDRVIALMPWFLLLDSSPRVKRLKQFGLVSITTLPRSTFDYARIQCCVLQLERNYQGDTTFNVFELL